jgi:hypothetical protein
VHYHCYVGKGSDTVLWGIADGNGASGVRMKVEIEEGMKMDG